MKDQFQTITAHEIKGLDFKITPYSLNTKLSFRFENLDHFIAFLESNGINAVEQSALIKTTLMELDLKPEAFFWVNFFEKTVE